MENDRNPIWYENKSDMDKPVSELLENLRSDLTRVRGKVYDIRKCKGWDEEIEYIDGAITSLIMAMAYSCDVIGKFEKKIKNDLGE